MKTSALSILMLTFFLSNLSAQKKSSFDLMIGVDYSNRTNLNVEGMVFTDANGDNINSNFKVVGTTNFRFGLSYNHAIGKKIWIKAGIRYTRLGYKYDIESFDVIQLGDVKTTDDFYHSFIEIPLLLRYELNSNKWSPFVELGMAANYYLQTKHIHTFKSLNHNAETEKLEKFENVNKGQYSAIVGIGTLYQLSERFQLILQPTFRYFLTNHIDDEMVPDIDLFDYRNYSLGLEMGCRMMI